MPKKQEKVSFKSLLNQLMENSLQSLITVAAQESKHLVSWLKNLSEIGRKVKTLLTTVILFSAGLGVLGIGISLYVSEMFPDLGRGVSHILVGLVIILIAALNLKISE
jgi:hypothetical protein